MDKRPRERDQTTALARWNHHIEPLGVTIRSSYRFYRDTFGIRAHTATVEGVHPLGERFTLTPSLRYYTQGKADFYYDPVYDPVIGEPYPPGRPRLSSSDHRLSAFGAITVGRKRRVAHRLRWSADFKHERYEQRSSWRSGRQRLTGLARLSADILQIGFSRRFLNGAPGRAEGISGGDDVAGPSLPLHRDGEPLRGAPRGPAARWRPRMRRLPSPKCVASSTSIRAYRPDSIVSRINAAAAAASGGAGR